MHRLITALMIVTGLASGFALAADDSAAAAVPALLVLMLAALTRLNRLDA